MARRPKPSNADLVETLEPFNLNRNARLNLTNLLLDRASEYPLKQQDLYRILKKRAFMSSRELPSDYTHEMQTLKIEMEKIFDELKELLRINGRNDTKTGDYIDTNDHPVCSNFFRKLEEAIDGYTADIQHDSNRPNKSEFREGLRKVNEAAKILEQQLNQLDAATRTYLSQEKVDTDDVVKLMHSLQDAYFNSKVIQTGKRNQARFNLCSAVTDAINSIGIAATTSRFGLLEEFIARLVELVDNETVLDIQDTLRAVLATR